MISNKEVKIAMDTLKGADGDIVIEAFAVDTLNAPLLRAPEFLDDRRICDSKIGRELDN